MQILQGFCPVEVLIRICSGLEVVGDVHLGNGASPLY